MLLEAVRQGMSAQVVDIREVVVVADIVVVERIGVGTGHLVNRNMLVVGHRAVSKKLQVAHRVVLGRMIHNPHLVYHYRSFVEQHMESRSGVELVRTYGLDAIWLTYECSWALS